MKNRAPAGGLRNHTVLCFRLPVVTDSPLIERRMNTTAQCARPWLDAANALATPATGLRTNDSRTSADGGRRCDAGTNNTPLSWMGASGSSFLKVVEPAERRLATVKESPYRILPN